MRESALSVHARDLDLTDDVIDLPRLWRQDRLPIHEARTEDESKSHAATALIAPINLILVRSPQPRPAQRSA